MQYCIYYQAHVKKETAWLVAGVLRSYEHLAFDRTYDKEKSIFEFLVPEGLELYFLQVMNQFEQKGLIDSLKKLPNRFESEVTV